jgi:hypothetical protein
MQALRIYAGPIAMQHLAQNGLQPQDIGVMPGAAGGPKGLILGSLDRFIFGDWLASTNHEVQLVGASIGAWRMATACVNDPIAGFQQLEHDYIRQHYALKPGEKFPSADTVSEDFGRNLASFYAGKVAEVLNHPRYKLHIITSRGRHLLRREGKVATPLGYLGAFLSNGIHRKAMGAWLERVVFSSQKAALPFDARDYRTRQLDLTEANFNRALQASCSIPFVLRSVRDIPGAPLGAYWDGGIIDYHLHLNYSSASTGLTKNLVLYPHFQKSVVPGWLDKSLKWRHAATPFLSNMVLLAPNPDWVKTLPNAKLPDRQDFARYGGDLQARIKAWSQAASKAEQLTDEFARWLARPDISLVETL